MLQVARDRDDPYRETACVRFSPLWYIAPTGFIDNN